MAKMPEHFTDTSGNWKSRAKETYRRTTLTKAQTEFCEYLGKNKQKTERAPNRNLKQCQREKVRARLRWIHAQQDNRGILLKEALQRIHDTTDQHTVI